MKILFLILSVAWTTDAAFALCTPGHQEVSRSTRYEEESCTAPGYCFAWGYNPATGAYEYFHGYHSDCPGRVRIEMETLVCRAPDGYTYTRSSEIYRGFCTVH
jgi:hypothetical protein